MDAIQRRDRTVQVPLEVLLACLLVWDVGGTGDEDGGEWEESRVSQMISLSAGCFCMRKFDVHSSLFFAAYF